MGFIMRILVIIYSLASGGAEHFTVDLCNALADSHDITLLTTNDDSDESNNHYLSELKPSVHYVNLKCSSGNSFAAIFRIFLYIKKHRPDIVHANTDLEQLMLPALLLRNARYFHTIHSLANVYVKKRILIPVYRILYRNRVTPVTISKQCSLSYRQLYKLDNDIIIFNGRSRPECSKNAESVKKMLDSFRGDGHLFIHVANYSPAKNQQVLFEAVEKVPGARLVVVGGGFPNTIIQSQDSERILFVGTCKNIADYLSPAEYFILSSLYEGLPLSLLEAMSYGIVPVATPAGGIQDVIRDGENGFLASGFDSDSLSMAMNRAIASPLNREKIRTEYTELYSMQSCASQYEHLFTINRHEINHS